MRRFSSHVWSNKTWYFNQMISASKHEQTLNTARSQHQILTLSFNIILGSQRHIVQQFWWWGQVNTFLYICLTRKTLDSEMLFLFIYNLGWHLMFFFLPSLNLFVICILIVCLGPSTVMMHLKMFILL